MPDFVYGKDLEQRCVRPGEWMIEGYRVVRVYARGHGTHWLIYDGKDRKGPMLSTLGLAREMIAEWRDKGK